MIILDNVHFSYGDKAVLAGFSEEFPENAVTCVLGPSGCGKTTLLNLLAGLITPAAGTVSGVGAVSFVFQEPRLIPQKTVAQNLDIVLRGAFRDKAERRAAVEKQLSAVDLGKCGGLYPHELSGGMAQRASLARAFAYPSTLLLMDEPFAALDVGLKKSIIDVFLSLLEQNPHTTVMVTHDIDDALLSADRIYVCSGAPMTVQLRLDIAAEKCARKLQNPDLLQLTSEICAVFGV
jgi:NitT/TauT family transport system ATP-binding protein